MEKKITHTYTMSHAEVLIAIQYYLVNKHGLDVTTTQIAIEDEGGDDALRVKVEVTETESSEIPTI